MARDAVRCELHLEPYAGNQHAEFLDGGIQPVLTAQPATELRAAAVRYPKFISRERYLRSAVWLRPTLLEPNRLGRQARGRMVGGNDRNIAEWRALPVAGPTVNQRQRLLHVQRFWRQRRGVEWRDAVTTTKFRRCLSRP